MASLRQKTLTGVAWNITEQLAVRGVTVMITLLLAHLLTPEDFGLVAMMTVFISIATALMDSGFTQALIRLPEAKQEDFNSAFYANLALGIFSYILLFFSAPLISEFYGQERLIALIRVAGLVVIINAFQVVMIACLSRALNFKVQFRATFPAAIISALVALTLAYFGLGVWALIAQMLVSATLIAIFLWWQSIWRPTLSWSAGSLKSMFQFGYKLFLSGVLDTGFKNIYVVVIAKLFSASVAGLYFFADRIRELLVFQLVGALQKVTYPALSSIQNEPERLKQGYKKIISVMSFIFFPLILFFAVLAEPIFHLLLPEKWWPSVIYIQLMCLASVLIPIHAVNLNILKVLGRSDLFLGLEVVKKMLGVLILLFSYKYGVVGILIGQIIASVLAFMPNSFYSKRLIGYTLYEQLSDFVPNFLLAGVIASGLWWLQFELQWLELTKLLVLSTSGTAAYLLGSFLLRLPAFYLARDLLMDQFRVRSA